MKFNLRINKIKLLESVINFSILFFTKANSDSMTYSIKLWIFNVFVI